MLNESGGMDYLLNQSALRRFLSRSYFKRKVDINSIKMGLISIFIFFSSVLSLKLICFLKKYISLIRLYQSGLLITIGYYLLNRLLQFTRAVLIAHSRDSLQSQGGLYVAILSMNPLSRKWNKRKKLTKENGFRTEKL